MFFSNNCNNQEENIITMKDNEEKSVEFFKELFKYDNNSMGLCNRDEWITDDWTDSIEGLVDGIHIHKQQYFHCLTHNKKETIKRGRGNNNSASTFQFLYADIDTNKKDNKYPDYDETVDKLIDLGISPSVLVDSGSGIHAYWLLDQAYQKDLLPHHFMRYLSSELGMLDDHQFKKSKILRVPYTTSSMGDGQVEILLDEYSTRYELYYINDYLCKHGIEEEEKREVSFRRIESDKEVITVDPNLTYKGLTIEEMLEDNGFLYHGNGRWLTPDSISGSAGVVIEGNKLHCHNESNPLYNKGNLTHSIESTYNMLYHLYADEPRGEVAEIKPLTSSLAVEVSHRGYTWLTEKMKGYGNTLTEDHQEALRTIVEGFAAMAIERQRGRVAYPLNTGCGKTTAIKAFIWALDSLKIYDKKIVVCAEKVEALCDLYKDLIDVGVDKNMLGLFHGYKYDPDFDIEKPRARYASQESNNNVDAPFLIMSHSRIKTLRDDIQKDTVINADLMIWDESLLTSESDTLEIKSIDSAVSQWMVEYRDRIERSNNPSISISIDEVRSLHDWLNEVNDIFNRSDEKVIDLPFLLDVDVSKKIINGFLNRNNKDNAKTLNTLINFYRKGVVRLHKNEGVIQFNQVIDDELDRICILDASYPIRTLCNHNNTITEQPIRFEKDYSPVTINTFTHGSGRNTTEDKQGAVVKEVLNICNHHNGEKILIVTYKEKNNINLVKNIRDKLDRNALDVRNKIRFITWGNETGLNRYSDCSVVICAGIMHRSNISLAGNLIGEKNDIGYELFNKDIENIKIGELSYILHQALSRGTCRKTIDGKAKPMTAYFWLYNGLNKVQEKLSEVMPNAVFDHYQPQHLIQQGVHDHIRLTTMSDLLNTSLDIRYERGEEKVSSRAVKADLKELGYIPTKREWDKIKGMAYSFIPDSRGFIYTEF